MDDDRYMCNSSYIPTSDEYFTSLGSFSSSILIIGGLITLGLFILFFEQVFYTNQTAHHGAKRNIYWIASVFPMMTLMSLVALVIPRASNVCLSVKMVYMSIGISHFTDLTMVMFGGEQLLVERGGDDTFNLRLSPLCCCCRCLPRPPVTKYSLRLVVLMTDQLPFAQAMYYVTVMILLSADNITLGNVKPSGAFLWLNLFKIASALFGVYGFMILSSFSKGYLDDFAYWKKSRSIRLLLMITSFQSMIFNIMANYGVFPCLPPYVTPTVYKQTVDNSLYLLEMMILGPYTYWQYHDQRFSTPITGLPSYRTRNSSNSITSSTKNSISGTISTTITAAADNSSDFTDEDEDSRSRSNSINSNDSTKPNALYAVDLENSTEVPAARTNSTNSSTRRNGSRNINSSERNSAFSTSDSLRESASSRNKARKISASNITSQSSGYSSASASNSARVTRDKTSKRSDKKTTPATSHNSNMEIRATTSQNSSKDNSTSPSSNHNSSNTNQNSTSNTNNTASTNRNSTRDINTTPSTTSNSASSKRSTRERSVSPSNSNSASNVIPSNSTSPAAPSLFDRALRFTPKSKDASDYVRFWEEED